MEAPKIINCLNCTKSSQCFSKLFTSEISFINQNKTEILYRKGENICKQGAFASSIIYISDGIIKLYLEKINNKNINIKILKTSDFIGLSSIYGENIYQYSSIALTDTTICLIEKESFRKILLNNGAFASEIIKKYCINEKYLVQKIQSFSNKQMHGKLADVLIYLFKNFNDIKIFNFLSRKDIAEFAGLSTETTVRLLSELKNENIINLNGKVVNILNLAKLEQISKQG